MSYPCFNVRSKQCICKRTTRQLGQGAFTPRAAHRYRVFRASLLLLAVFWFLRPPACENECQAVQRTSTALSAAIALRRYRRSAPRGAELPDVCSKYSVAVGQSHLGTKPTAISTLPSWNQGVEAELLRNLLSVLLSRPRHTRRRDPPEQVAKSSSTTHSGPNHHERTQAQWVGAEDPSSCSISL